ncbi:N-acetylglucosaminyl-phosphatidylinositol biosynthetic protein gpi1 [Grifola frondosa]|uniref:N-acetylglucosaminyl-phosphatidylinositol biosynthetic protein gpi1 n=1 Tax=Grifola frondosa TaxID=5627 RepID=A0A1C7MKH9_GRIFR|nr:N-acetylglucosaminyl-phosphatidylinositol biosynthetic protein gpi1 [Grifola frondosa]
MSTISTDSSESAQSESATQDAPPAVQWNFPLSPIPENPLGIGRHIKTAAALIIGDEILNGKTLDRNSNYFARFCFEHGIELKRIEVIADDEDEIIEASRRMVATYDFVITSGGIGPTHDDITYASLAKSFELPLTHHEETLARMTEMTRNRPDIVQQTAEQRTARERMALFPAGAEVLFIAPDVWVPVVRLGGKLCVFPGIPKLFQRMLDGLLPFLPLPPPSERPFRQQIFTSLPESSIAPYLTELQARTKAAGIRVGSYPLLSRGVYVALIGRDEPTLACFHATQGMRPKTDKSETHPSVLGRCMFPIQGSAAPSLELDNVAAGALRFVYYQPLKKDSMRFYSFDFRELDILPSQSSTKISTAHSHNPVVSILTHDFTRICSPKLSSPILTGTILNQLNLAHLLMDSVNRAARHDEISSSPKSQSASAGHPLTSSDSVAYLRPYTCFQPLVATLRQLQIPLREYFTSVEQFDVRFEQSVYVLSEMRSVYRDKALSVDSISRYIKFHNCVWLVLNDIIVGVAFGSFLCENKAVLARMLEYFLEVYTVDRMQLALLWLNNWPAGLKLNTELSQFYCHSLLGIISGWGWILRHLAPHFPFFIWVVGAMGWCGMTMIVSLLSDTLSLLTAHLQICYLISTAVFSQQLSLLASLWNLFRGKRYNVLRNRIDSWDYEIDQLLLGTILFTLVAFLYPTVLTYYALFATTRLAIILMHATLDTISALLNHFPLFALLLRVKDPMRVPGGVCFKRSSTEPEALILQSQPASLSSIFRHYAHLWSGLSSHYHPLRLFRQLMSGRRLTTIPRVAIRYSMIPSKVEVDSAGSFTAAYNPT